MDRGSSWFLASRGASFTILGSDIRVLFGIVAILTIIHLWSALEEQRRASVLRTVSGLTRMSEAADQENAMDKHPVTPGEVLPVRDLYGELLLLEGHSEDAVEAFRASLERTSNRRNALEGLERAREML
jgi:hypothetical protein